MNINVPLEIDDVVWVIRDRAARKRIIKGVSHSKWDNEVRTQYLIDNYGSQVVKDFEYFKSEKDAEIEIARKILEDLKDGE